MQCPFCKHEVNKGIEECPYCHYKFEVDAEVLSSDERDSFDGVTIEEDGSTSGGQTTYEEAGSYEARPEEQQNAGYGSGFQFQRVGGYGCLIWMLVFLFIMIFVAVAFVKVLFAVPLLGFFVLGYFLNSMFHWF